jgi:hypothetical protein
MHTLTLVANFAAYSFAPPILVTPLGSLSVIIGCVGISVSPQYLFDLAYSAILASYLLDEELGHLGRLGCTICILGSLIIVIHAPADKDIQTVDEILRYAVQPGASQSPSHSVIRLNGAQASYCIAFACSSSRSRWFMPSHPSMAVQTHLYISPYAPLLALSLSWQSRASVLP